MADDTDNFQEVPVPVPYGVDKLKPNTRVGRVRALYAYAAPSSDHLSFEPGQLISVTFQRDGGWWQGHLVWDGSDAVSAEGLFPAVYCQVVSHMKRVSKPIKLKKAQSLAIIELQRQLKLHSETATGTEESPANASNGATDGSEVQSNGDAQQPDHDDQQQQQALLEQQERERLEHELQEKQERERLEREAEQQRQRELQEQQDRERLERELQEKQERERLEREAEEQRQREIQEQQERERLEHELQEKQERERLEREAEEQRQREIQEQQDRERLERELQEKQERERLQREAEEQRQRELREQQELEELQRERERQAQQAQEREREAQRQREIAAEQEREREAQRQRELAEQLQQQREAAIEVPTLSPEVRTKGLKAQEHFQRVWTEDDAETRGIATPRPVWVPDNTSPSCRKCHATFTFFFRRVRRSIVRVRARSDSLTLGIVV